MIAKDIEVGSKFSKMEEDAILELLTLTNVEITKDNGLAEALDEVMDLESGSEVEDWLRCSWECEG